MAQRQLLSNRERSDFLRTAGGQTVARLEERRVALEALRETAEAEGNTHAADVHLEKLGLLDWMLARKRANGEA